MPCLSKDMHLWAMTVAYCCNSPPAIILTTMTIMAKGTASLQCTYRKAGTHAYSWRITETSEHRLGVGLSSEPEEAHLVEPLVQASQTESPPLQDFLENPKKLTEASRLPPEPPCWRQRTPRWKSLRMEGVSTSELSRRRRHPASGLTQTTCPRGAPANVLHPSGPGVQHNTAPRHRDVQAVTQRWGPRPSTRYSCLSLQTQVLVCPKKMLNP
ncbi:uncharacterized protein LOC119827306 [Arvicola amphibius]|uniref:uncharacterized protein LOC119827306 n=1 Tax=Arvicola amphibius TaxID=1047088 RepID=UPI001C07FCD8|nr:uncharacterized protein LOC119827306 [Arvicola amphibius]